MRIINRDLPEVTFAKAIAVSGYSTRTVVTGETQIEAVKLM